MKCSNAPIVDFNGRNMKGNLSREWQGIQYEINELWEDGRKFLEKLWRSWRVSKGISWAYG